MSEFLNVLLVEDDDVAAESVTRSLKKVLPKIPVTVAENGRVALNILRGLDKENEIKKPFIVLLDLNMPVMNGFELLEEVRNSPELQDIVIFILSTSNEDNDRTKAYHHNVAGYMVKSAVGPQFSKLATFLDSYRSAIELGA